MNSNIILLWFCILLVFIAICRVFVIKLEKPQDYMKKAHYMVMMFGAYLYANKVLESALQKFTDLTEEEISFLNFQIGINLVQKRKYNDSINYFEKSISFIQSSNIPYNKAYALMIKAYLNVGKKEKAREIYRNLRKKEKYDIKFEKLSVLEKELFN